MVMRLIHDNADLPAGERDNILKTFRGIGLQAQHQTVNRIHVFFIGVQAGAPIPPHQSLRSFNLVLADLTEGELTEAGT